MIVANFNVLECDLAKLITGGETLAVDDLNLQTMEKAFGTSLIKAVALAAHAAQKVK